MADSCQCMANPLQYFKVISLQLKQINLKNISMSYLKYRVKDRTSMWCSDLLLGIYLKNTYLKRYIHPNVHSSTIYNCQDVEAT